MRFALCCFISLLCWSVSGTAKPPNVIVIMSDDQGYGEFSFNGNPIARTPHFDRLATQSIRFTDFHVAPMCTPTRGQLMTGMDAFRNAAINVSSGRTLLKADLKTMADLFREAGYRTGLFGKWHLGDNFPFRPEDRGFDEAIWFPASHINSAPDYWDNDYFDDTYMHNGQREKFEGYCTDVFFQETMDWIADRSAQSKPFFTFLALNATHWPHFVPEHYRAPVREMMQQHPEVVAHLKDKDREELISFLAMGANLDENLGRLDQFLETKQLKNDTIVVFLTDNGSTFGSTYFNAGMQGKKTTLWEGGHRVPLLVSWPQGELGPARDIDELTHVQDLLPTLAELVGIDSALPESLDGVSLAPLMRDPQASLDDRMLVINYGRMPQFKVTYTKDNPAIPHRDGAAVLWGKWRLLENRALYDVSTDLHQDHDVTQQFPQVVAKMRAHLDAWWTGVKDDVMVPQRVVIGDDRENPLLLSACEWLDVFIDQQRQVRRGLLKNGTWHLTAAQAGTYSFTLHRWPEESDLRLTDAIPETKVTDGTYSPGEAIAIAGATLSINGAPPLRKKSSPSDRSIEFTAKLMPGPLTLDTTFVDAEQKPLLGAYYVTVTRL